MKPTSLLSRLAIVALFMAGGAAAYACPFCSVEQLTLTEETESADAVVLARLIKEAPPETDEVNGEEKYDPNSGTATFKVVEVLHGPDSLAGDQELQAVYFGEPDRERIFLIMGLGTEPTDWTTPLPLSEAAVEYVRKLPSVPKEGAERLEFFQEYLEHEDPLLAQDAYDEFARASYAAVQGLGPKMHHDRLVNWIQDMEISPSRRRLYLTMLGVCGSEADLPMLRSMIASDIDAIKPQLETLVANGLAMGGPVGLPAVIELVDQDERRKKLGLDALVACYLTLRGPEGLDLIDERFLKNSKAEYTHVYSTIMALRFHGDEDTTVIPRERLLASMRLLLDNPDFADQVILDLSRWEDWSVLERLAEMFKSADEDGYVKQPVVTYLTVASEQPGDVGSRATAALAELERLDPKTVEQARSLMAFGALGRARAESSDDNAVRQENEAAEDSAAGFAASAADRETNTSDIPDPATFGQEDQVESEAQFDAEIANAGGTARVERTAADKPSRAVSQLDEVGEPAEPSPMLMVGVPLLAAGLLLGVYWLILRVGAV